jgi:Ser/Thr protein kinase RdoA (MazF antagonist)
VEVLTYVPGEVGVPPFPAWVAGDDVLVSVAELQRRLHVTAPGFVPPPGSRPGIPYLAPGAEGSLVCHNDLCVENVVVRDGRAAAAIDFDYAAPVDRRFDVAVAARHWVPLWSPDHLDAARAGVDQRARFGTFCDVHELTVDDRLVVRDLAVRFLEQALRAVRERAEAGIGGFPALWRNGYEAANTAARAWLASLPVHR